MWKNKINKHFGTRAILKRMNSRIEEFQIASIANLEKDLLKGHLIQQPFEDYCWNPAVNWKKHKIALIIILFEVVCNLRWLTLSLVSDKQTRVILGKKNVGIINKIKILIGIL